MTLYDSITETIGETPLVRLNRMNPPGTHVYVKIERGNPAGSIKDRAALSMINDAVARGEVALPVNVHTRIITHFCGKEKLNMVNL